MNDRHRVRMYALKVSSVLLESKKFRDNLVKTIQYACKFVINQYPQISGLASLKLFSEHAAASRRIYRWGSFLGHFYTVLVLLSKSFQDDLRFFTIMVFSFLSNFYDAVTYVQVLMFKEKEKTSSEYYAALFYFCGLFVSLTKHLEQLLPGGLAGYKEEEKREMKTEAVLGSVRDISNMMTTVDAVFPRLGVQKREVAFFGFLAGLIGLYQNAVSVHKSGSKKGDN